MNTPILADFKLSVWCHWMQCWEEMHTILVSWKDTIFYGNIIIFYVIILQSGHLLFFPFFCSSSLNFRFPRWNFKGCVWTFLRLLTHIAKLLYKRIEPVCIPNSRVSGCLSSCFSKHPAPMLPMRKLKCRDVRGVVIQGRTVPWEQRWLWNQGP